MTAGSYMYIGPQGIVHGTTITVMNAARMKAGKADYKGMLFITAGLGGMSGAQPKAANIAGLVSITAEVNYKAASKRHEQGWVDLITDDVNEAISLALDAQKQGIARSIAYQGNIIDLWEALVERKVTVDLGSDQTSLHNPFAGGYYPVGFNLEESNAMMANEPERFKEEVYKSLRRHARAINTLSERGMYFFDYGNAFLLEASRAGAEVMNISSVAKEEGKEFKYPSYVQDILGPMCFDYGFGPFRWVCCSGLEEDLDTTDKIAGDILEEMLQTAPEDIARQISDNLQWIRQAQKNKLVVGSQARILYADADGRMKIGLAFNQAIADGRIKGPIVLGRDHHDVSGTDSPYRETSNIYDGSRFTADMAVQNFAGDAFRGATWVSLHNGGGVGWGEVINGGFGMLLDGSEACSQKVKSMLHWDVNNGIARRAWARNKEAVIAIERAMKSEPLLKVTLANEVDENLLP
jgi:urocanate hydratase